MESESGIGNLKMHEKLRWGDLWKHPSRWATNSPGCSRVLEGWISVALVHRNPTQQNHLHPFISKCICLAQFIQTGLTAFKLLWSPWKSTNPNMVSQGWGQHRQSVSWQVPREQLFFSKCKQFIPSPSVLKHNWWLLWDVIDTCAVNSFRFMCKPSIWEHKEFLNI